MKHKWTVMLVVLVTTIVTAQEAFKQYDDLKAQAAAWATSRLWASLLSTPSAPEEESPEEQRAACTAQKLPTDNSRQSQSLMSSHANDTGNTNSHEERAAANQTIKNESDALEDKHHFDTSEATAEPFEQTSEVALLTEQSSVEAEEGGQPEALSAEPDTNSAQDDAVDEDSRRYAEQQEAHSISRALKHAVAEEISNGVDLSVPAQETRALVETRAQARAIRRAVKALHDSIDRSKRIELRIIRRERRVDPHDAANISLRAENSSYPQANTFSDALSAQINYQHTASLSAQRRMCE